MQNDGRRLLSLPIVADQLSPYLDKRDLGRLRQTAREVSAEYERPLGTLRYYGPHQRTQGASVEREFKHLYFSALSDPTRGNLRELFNWLERMKRRRIMFGPAYYILVPNDAVRAAGRSPGFHRRLGTLLSELYVYGRFSDMAHFVRECLNILGHRPPANATQFWTPHLTRILE